MLLSLTVYFSFFFISYFLFFFFFFFFFNDTATTEIYTLSLHDALPISRQIPLDVVPPQGIGERRDISGSDTFGDRKSTRLNSSHVSISYAVFCLKKKKKKKKKQITKKKKKKTKKTT